MLTKKEEVIASPDDVLDFVFILGKDELDYRDHNDLYKKIEADCKSKKLKYLILGNGETAVTYDDIKRLPKARNVAILGHGSIIKDVHRIVLEEETDSYSAEVLLTIQQKTGSKHIIFCSCYGGRIIHDLEHYKDGKLKEGTFLTAFSPPDEFSFSKDNAVIVSAFVERLTPGMTISMFSFMRDMIKTIPQTMVFACQLEDELASQTLLRRNRGLNEVYLDAQRFCDYQINILNDFVTYLLANKSTGSLLEELKKEFPDLDLDDFRAKLNTENSVRLLQSTMSPEEVQAFQSRSLLNHIFLQDTVVVDAWLKQGAFGSELLVQLIGSSLEDDFGKMVDLLLKNKANARHGQNENAFCPEATYSDYASAFFKYGPNSMALILYTPLTLALEMGKFGVVEALLNHGADIFLADKNGTVPATLLNNTTYKPLFAAPLNTAYDVLRCGEQFLDMIPVNVALSSQPSILDDIKDAIEKNKIFELICREENDMGFLCRESNVPKNERVFKAYQAFLMATRKLHLRDMLNFTIETALNDSVKESLTAQLLIAAVRNGDIEYVKAHLHHGLAIDTPDVHGRTPLYFALAGNHLDVVDELLANDVNLFATDVQITLLRAGLKYFKPDMIRRLVFAGLQLIERDERDQLFRGAVESGDLVLVKQLLNWKADINSPNAHSETALKIAARLSNSLNIPETERYRYKEIIVMLLKAGAIYLFKDSLVHLSLKNMSLVHIRLKNANLTGTDLSGSDLTGTDLRKAVLNGVNLTSVKGIDANTLLLAKSIRDLKVDGTFLRTMDYKTRSKVMAKMVRDYKKFITKNSIDEVASKLVEIIDDETHFLKFNPGLLTFGYGTTAYYASVVNFGRERLVKLLELRQSIDHEPFSDELLDKLKLIIETNVSSVESRINRFFSSGSDKELATQELAGLVNQRGIEVR